MVILITGTPGTGKTKIAKELAKKIGYSYFDVNNSFKKEVIYGYDKKLKCKIVDQRKLKRELVKVIKRNNKIIIDSHLSQSLPKKYAKLCIVTKCDLKELKKRLKKRGYSSFKIKENLDAETFNVCYHEAAENKHNILIVNTYGRTAKEVVGRILAKVKKYI